MCKELYYIDYFFSVFTKGAILWNIEFIFPKNLALFILF